jgi:hypothetical protein
MNSPLNPREAAAAELLALDLADLGAAADKLGNAAENASQSFTRLSVALECLELDNVDRCQLFG